MKTVGGLRKLRHRGGPLVTWVFTCAAAAYNIAAAPRDRLTVRAASAAPLIRVNAAAATSRV